MSFTSRDVVFKNASLHMHIIEGFRLVLNSSILFTPSSGLFRVDSEELHFHMLADFHTNGPVKERYFEH